jgi:hypothetical protein
MNRTAIILLHSLNFIAQIGTILLRLLLPKTDQPTRIIVIILFHSLVFWQSHDRRLDLDSKVCAVATDVYRNDCYTVLTLILLTWRIWWVPNNASKWQKELNSAFKGLTLGCSTPAVTVFSIHYSKPTTKNVCANIQNTVSDTPYIGSNRATTQRILS